MNDTCSVQGCYNRGICRGLDGSRLCVKHWQEHWKENHTVVKPNTYVGGKDMTEVNEAPDSNPPIPKKKRTRVKGIWKKAKDMIERKVPYDAAVAELAKIYIESGKSEKKAKLCSSVLLWNACKKMGIDWIAYQPNGRKKKTKIVNS